MPPAPYGFPYETPGNQTAARGTWNGVRGTADNEMGTEGVFDKRRLQPYD